MDILEVSRFCETILGLLNDPWGLSGAWEGGMHGSCFSLLLAFRGGGSASPWMMIGDKTLFK